VGDDDVGAATFRREALGHGAAEELAARVDSGGACGGGGAGGGIDAENRYAGLLEVAEHVAVVAGEFDDERVRPEVARLEERLGVLASVFEERVGEGREVLVLLAKEERGVDGLRDLNERTVRAEGQDEREARFGPGEQLFRQEMI